ncbi:MAG TPA: malonyl-[acyl-carrier protein] O-methyltransferase BioC, partial [Thiothrix sp.]|nr:malonyl-[acyl-carrier protein] O-methyltransferase BioC [Thiothrix sp.]
MLDKAQLRRHFDRAAKQYDAAAVLQREVGQRLYERLDYINIQPERVLDLGCGTGFLTQKLLKQYPKAQLIALDIAVNMLKITQKQGGWFRKPKVICADAEQLPLKDASVDVIVSNLMLQWCNDLPNSFAEMRRVLKPNGMVLFSSFGTDTLKELRESWQRVDQYAHSSTFADMHDVGDALMQAGFAQPVMDMDMITMTYHSVRELMQDLKQIGANNADRQQRKSLTGKQRLLAFEQAY